MEAGIDDRVTLEYLSQAMGTLGKQTRYKLYSEHQVHGEVIPGPSVYQQSGHLPSKPLTSSSQKTYDAHNAKSTTDSQTNFILICDICDDQFASKHELISHLYNHEDLDYFCTKCEETYGDEETFRQHKEGCRKLFVWTTGNEEVDEKAKGLECFSSTLNSINDMEKGPIAIKEERVQERSLINVLPTNTVINAEQGNYSQCSPAMTREVILDKMSSKSNDIIKTNKKGPECMQFNVNTNIHDVIITRKETDPECSSNNKCAIPGDANIETDKASKCSPYNMNTKCNVFITRNKKGSACSLRNINVTHSVFVTEKDKGTECSQYNLNKNNNDVFITRNKTGQECSLINNNAAHCTFVTEKDMGPEYNQINMATKNYYTRNKKGPECSLMNEATHVVFVTEKDKGPECNQINMNTRINDVFNTSNKKGPECSLINYNATHSAFVTDKDKGLECNQINMNTKNNHVFITRNKKGSNCSLINNNKTHGAVSENQGLEYNQINMNTEIHEVITRKGKGLDSSDMITHAAFTENHPKHSPINMSAATGDFLINNKGIGPIYSLTTCGVVTGPECSQINMDAVTPAVIKKEKDCEEGAQIKQEPVDQVDTVKEPNMIGANNAIKTICSAELQDLVSLAEKILNAPIKVEGEIKTEVLEPVTEHLNSLPEDNRQATINRNMIESRVHTVVGRNRNILQQSDIGNAVVSENRNILHQSDIGTFVNENTNILQQSYNGNAVVSENSNILHQSYIGNAIVNENRNILQQSYIGNAVVSENSNILHQSYIGNAIVNENRNILQQSYIGNAVVSGNRNILQKSDIGNAVVSENRNILHQSDIGNAVVSENRNILQQSGIGNAVVSENRNILQQSGIGYAVVSENRNILQQSGIGYAVVSENRNILQQSDIGNDIERNSVIVFVKDNNNSGNQNNNIYVSKLPAVPSHVVAQNSVETEQEQSHQDIMEEPMVPGTVLNGEVDMVGEPDTARSVVEQPRMPRQQSFEEQPKQWYCGKCKKRFCTQSILTLHHHFKHRLQLCLCDVCDTPIQPPSVATSAKQPTTPNILNRQISNKNPEKAIIVVRPPNTEKVNTPLLKTYSNLNRRKMAIQHRDVSDLEFMSQTMTRDNDLQQQRYISKSGGMLQSVPGIANSNFRQNNFLKKQQQKNMLLKRLGISKTTINNPSKQQQKNKLLKRLGISQTTINNPSMKQNNLLIEPKHCLSQQKGMAKDNTDSDQNNWFSIQRDFLAANWGMSKASIDKILQKKMVIRRLATSQSPKQNELSCSEKGGMSQACIDNPSQAAVEPVDNIKKDEIIEIDSDNEDEMEIETLDILENGLDSDPNMDSEFQLNPEAAAPSGHLPVVYRCGECNTRFGGRGELIDHMRIHIHMTVSDKPHICHICTKQFRKRCYLKTHLEVHDTEKRKCPNCDRLFNSTGSMARHKQYFCKAKTNTERYACDRCNKEYCTRTTMNHHKKFYCYDRTQPMPYECDICNNRYPELYMLNYHKKRHGQTYTCDYCKRNFANMYNLRRHLIVHTGVKPYKCKVCKKRYARKGRLDNHLRTHTNTKITCDTCGKGFIGKESLKRHMQDLCNEKVFKDKPFVCDVCKKRFANKLAIVRHITNNHLKKFNCDVCDKSFGQMCKLVNHIELHSGRTMHCAVCKKRFNRVSDLFYHERLHPDGARQYFCDTCEKKFVHPSSLLYHNIRCRRKSEANKHHCDICDRNFVDKTKWSRHKQICKGMITENCYQCDVCKRRYQTKRAIAVHITKCHSKKFICDVCNKSFGQKGNLIYHIRKGRDHDKTCKEKKYRSSAKIYSCRMCDQKFSLKSSLIYHNRRHRIGKNNYSCLKCHKQFAFKYALTHHMQQDCNEKEVVGNKKIVKTKVEPNNKINEKPVTTNNKGSKKIVNKDVSCPTCNAQFTEKSSLAYHKLHRCGKDRNRQNRV